MRRSKGGRFTVGDKMFPVSGAALAYAQAKTHADGQTRYVREIGKEGSLYIVERNTDGITSSRAA